MEWFKGMSLMEKIEAYGELMFAIGSDSGDTAKMQEELGAMHYYIAREIREKEGEK